MHVNYIEWCLAHSSQSVFNTVVLSFNTFTSLSLGLALGPWGSHSHAPLLPAYDFSSWPFPHHFFTCFPTS